MAGTRKPGSSSRRGAAGRPTEPVLGNDPFVRGAAPRPVAAEERTPELAVASPPLTGPERPTGTAPSEGGSASPGGVPPPGSRPQEPAAVRSRLDVLEARVERAAAGVAARLEDLGAGRATGERARGLLRTVSGLLPAVRGRLGALVSLFIGPVQLDAFGMDRALVERASPVLEFLYRSWWRVEPRQIENVPSEGPTILVANHAGALPWDALVLMTALLRDHPSRRELRPLLDERALAMRIAGVAAVRLGAVPATPDNALALLRRGSAVGVFPEGSRGAERPWPERYHLHGFGRGGFAKIAFRSGAPIVPCAIVGSEETRAGFVRPGWMSELLGVPFLAAAPPLPLAPLGLFPLPSRWSLRFGEPVLPLGGPDAADDPVQVLDLTERVRTRLQQMLDEDVAARRSVYL